MRRRSTMETASTMAAIVSLLRNDSILLTLLSWKSDIVLVAGGSTQIEIF